MPQILDKDHYWVMPAQTMEWEVMQYRQRDGMWYRIGLERPIKSNQITTIGLKVDTISLLIKTEMKGKKMKERFMQDAVDSGFTQEQADFMWEALAKKPHTHPVEEIVGLDEAVAEAVAEAVEEEEDEDEDEEED